MTGERQFNEADQARIAQFRAALDGLRAAVHTVSDPAARALLLGLLNALDSLTQVRGGP